MIQFNEYFLIYENTFRRKPYDESKPISVGQIVSFDDKTGTRYASIENIDKKANSILIRFVDNDKSEWVDFNEIRTHHIQLDPKRYTPPGKKVVKKPEPEPTNYPKNLDKQVEKQMQLPDEIKSKLKSDEEAFQKSRKAYTMRDLYDYDPDDIRAELRRRRRQEVEQEVKERQAAEIRRQAALSAKRAQEQEVLQKVKEKADEKEMKKTDRQSKLDNRLKQIQDFFSMTKNDAPNFSHKKPIKQFSKVPKETQEEKNRLKAAHDEIRRQARLDARKKAFGSGMSKDPKVSKEKHTPKYVKHTITGKDYTPNFSSEEKARMKAEHDEIRRKARERARRKGFN